MTFRRQPALAIAVLALAMASCEAHLFSSIPMPDQSQPIVEIHTRGGVEYGVGTEYGILFLGRSAQEGPCTVRYFLGPTPIDEDGDILPAGNGLYRASIDLDHQRVKLLPRDLEPSDEPFLMLWAGFSATEVAVRLAGEPVEGDVIEDPGFVPPPGAGLFVRDDDGRLLLAGLVAAAATTAAGERYFVFTGPERLREMLAIPVVTPPPKDVIYRPDDITVIKERDPGRTSK